MSCVLINGGSRGIGASMVELFSKEGYSVAFTYKNSDSCAKALAERTGALAVKADSSSEAEVVAAVSFVRERLGAIDVLINNAAISSFSLLSDISYAEWNEIFATNVGGAFLYSKAVLPDMISKKCGRIINVSSMWGITGSSCEVHYSSTKAALIGFTKALAKEVGPSGITVNAIAPGLIDTDMNKSLSDEDKKSLVDETPLMRIGKPADVAEAALFLASDKASFITGEVLSVNGGFLI